jgi:hypothetical protein
MGILGPYHGCTGTTWQDDCFRVFKDLDTSHSQLFGLFPEAAVEEGLAAASLLVWKFNLASSPLQQLYRRQANFRH